MFHLDAGYWTSITARAHPDDLEVYTDASQTFYVANHCRPLCAGLYQDTGDLCHYAEDDLGWSPPRLPIWVWF